MRTEEMSYKELQDKAAELEIDFGRPLNQVRKVDLQQAINSKMVDTTSTSDEVLDGSNIKQLPTETIKDRIVQLAEMGLTKIDIQHRMENEGYNIRYAYILVVLKNEGITVPKAKRGRKPSTSTSVEE